MPNNIRVNLRWRTRAVRHVASQHVEAVIREPDGTLREALIHVQSESGCLAQLVVVPGSVIDWCVVVKSTEGVETRSALCRYTASMQAPLASAVDLFGEVTVPLDPSPVMGRIFAGAPSMVKLVTVEPADPVEAEEPPAPVLLSPEPPALPPAPPPAPPPEPVEKIGHHVETAPVGPVTLPEFAGPNLPVAPEPPVVVPTPAGSETPSPSTSRPSSPKLLGGMTAAERMAAQAINSGQGKGSRKSKKAKSKTDEPANQ